MKKKRKGIHFHGYFSVFMSLTILTSAALWVIYGDIPTQYYLPAGFGIVVAISVVAFIILDKKIKF